MNDSNVPLCVSFDGILTPVDTAHEKLIALLKNSPRSLLHRLGALRHGKDAFWRQVTALGRIDPTLIPLRQDLIDWLREQHRHGRQVVLLADDDLQAATQLAEYLDLFDDVTPTAEGRGATARRRLDGLIKRYGALGFDFVGGVADSSLISGAARRVIVVGDAVKGARVARTAEVARIFATQRPTLRAWVRGLRLHQWVKNALIFVPALLAHALFMPGVIGVCMLAFVAFGVCASSVYILNDLFDLAADRRHPRKRHRPFAAGTLSARGGTVAAILLLCAAAAIASIVTAQFAAVLALYYVLTWTYSLRLKRVALVDVMVLAALYTIRIIAGAAATSVPLSFWLLAFSVFIFLSLGFVKRYAELAAAQRAGEAGSNGRGYDAHDLPVIMSMGTASGYSAIVVMALYINSADSLNLYHHHRTLWLICPLMLFWVSRVWTLTARGQMHDDPVVFALRDRVSLLILGTLGLIVVLSI